MKKIKLGDEIRVMLPGEGRTKRKPAGWIGNVEDKEWARIASCCDVIEPPKEAKEPAKTIKEPDKVVIKPITPSKGKGKK